MLQKWYNFTECIILFNKLSITEAFKLIFEFFPHLVVHRKSTTTEIPIDSDKPTNEVILQRSYVLYFNSRWVIIVAVYLIQHGGYV